jgi:peptidoglycan hydrolase-like protein with peptidoglycan-binding domain
MTKLLTALLSMFFACAIVMATQNASPAVTKGKTRNSSSTRGPIFRATSEQIRQAQTILKQRAFYGGEQTGTLDPGTRDGLKKYQEAEGLKVTGTLNRLTLEKMGIVLTDKQKAM